MSPRRALSVAYCVVFAPAVGAVMIGVVSIFAMLIVNDDINYSTAFLAGAASAPVWAIGGYLWLKQNLR